MPVCYHCGEQIYGESFKCEECGQIYCPLHSDPINHDCNVVKESLNYQQYQTSPSYVSVPQTSPSIQQRIDQQQTPHGVLPQQTTQGYTSGQVRGTTDGSYTWYREDKYIPPNAFDPDSGIAFKGILWPHKSEFLHFIIGVSLIYIVGLLSYLRNYDALDNMGYGWAVYMLAGFYATAFLFHEFGHRQSAKHFGLQTKFRLLTFGMLLTMVTLIGGIMSILSPGFIFPSLALPGAVVVLGLDKIDRKTGWCKSMGPFVNLIYGTILLVISFLLPKENWQFNTLLGQAASMNFFLGLFNMIPIGILDGQNIFKWSKKMYFFLVITLLAGLLTFYVHYLMFDISWYYPEEIKPYLKVS